MEECVGRIFRFIKYCGYTYNVQDIIDSYKRYYKRNYYCSYTMNICIRSNLNDIKFLDKKLSKKLTRKKRKLNKQKEAIKEMIRYLGG